MMEIYFGGLELDEDSAPYHFMLVGATGSGKTLNFRMMMGGILPDIISLTEQRAVVFDVKQDNISVISGILEDSAKKNNLFIDINDHLIITNPFDERCYEWDMATDITSPEVALQVATILIPEEESQNRFFSDAARDLLNGVMNAFIEKHPKDCKDGWGLSDLVYTMRSEDRIRQVLSNTVEGQDLLKLYLGMEKTTLSIVATVRARLAPFEVPAALWKRARTSDGKPRRFSLEEFLSSSKILILGNHQTASAPIQAINRLLFRRLSELILSQHESKSRRTWIFLDEVRKLGKLEGLDDLMTNGRSKGACVVLGFQDISGFRSVYGKDVADEITSMPASYGILRVSGAETPQWASQLFGERDAVQKMRNRSFGMNNGGWQQGSGESEQFQKEQKLYLPSEFRLLPNPTPGEPLEGIFFSAFLKNKDGKPSSWELKLPSEEVAERLIKPSTTIPDFTPWTGGLSEKRLKPWTAEDYKRLGIPASDDLEQTEDLAGDQQGAVLPERKGSTQPLASEVEIEEEKEIEARQEQARMIMIHKALTQMINQAAAKIVGGTSETKKES
jgi:type IV secretory pathway TraG/TraD family ATPase VirD4